MRVAGGRAPQDPSSHFLQPPDQGHPMTAPRSSGAHHLTFAAALLPLAALLACQDQSTPESPSSERSVTASGAVSLAPGARIQDSVRKYGEGTAFVIQAGTHRMQSITPKSGMTFTGE